MIKVAPSILSADFVNLERDIRSLPAAGADYVHVDVMDGMFVPNITIGIPVVAAISRIAPLPLDVHLMIEEPIRYVRAFREAGADLLTVHLEACKDVRQTLLAIRECGAKAGLSIRPATPVSELLPYLDLCDMILADPMFMITKEELDAILQPENFTGRSEQQTEEFVDNCIRPILAANASLIGEHYEMKN